MTVPGWIRHLFERAETAIGVLIVGSALLSLLTLLGHAARGVSHYIAPIALDALTIVIYARTALFFAYGELQPRTVGTTEPRDETDPL